MKIIRKHLSHKEVIIVPIGDCHIGEKQCDYELLEKTISFIKNTPNAYAFLNGDILNVAHTTSKSSVFEQDMTLDEQMEKAVELFEPIKDKIFGAISGNHSQRLEKIAGFNPLLFVCRDLGIPYCGYSTLLHISLGKKGRVRKLDALGHFTILFHHSVGGGRTAGSKLNVVEKLRNIVGGCCAYVIGHNHQLATAPVSCGQYNVNNGVFKRTISWLVCGGSYVKWDDNYSEKIMLEPAVLGSPKIILKVDSNRNKKVNVIL